MTAEAEQIRALVREHYEAFNRGDAEGLAATVAPDIVDHNAAAGQAQGRQGLIAALEQLRAAFCDLRIRVERVVVEGDLAADRITAEGRHRGEFFGAPPTGRPVSIRSKNLYRIRDARIAETWRIEDIYGLMAQLGGSGLPSPAQTNRPPP